MPFLSYKLCAGGWQILTCLSILPLCFVNLRHNFWNTASCGGSIPKINEDSVTKEKERNNRCFEGNHERAKLSPWVASLIFSPSMSEITVFRISQTCYCRSSSSKELCKICLLYSEKEVCALKMSFSPKINIRLWTHQHKWTWLIWLLKYTPGLLCQSAGLFYLTGCVKIRIIRATVSMEPFIKINHKSLKT